MERAETVLVLSEIIKNHARTVEFKIYYIVPPLIRRCRNAKPSL